MAADDMSFQMSDDEMFDELDELSGEFENDLDDFAASIEDEDDDEPVEGVIVSEEIIIVEPAPAAEAPAPAPAPASQIGRAHV